MPSIELTQSAEVKEISLEAVVTRCGCTGDFRDFHEDLGDGQYGPCPTPRKVEDLGVIAYRSNNFFKQMAWTISQTVKGRRA